MDKSRQFMVIDARQKENNISFAFGSNTTVSTIIDVLNENDAKIVDTAIVTVDENAKDSDIFTHEYNIRENDEMPKKIGRGINAFF